MNIFEFVLLIPQGLTSFSQAVIDVLFYEVTVFNGAIGVVLGVPTMKLSIWIIISGVGLVYIVVRRFLPV